MQKYLPIKDYAILGNCHTAALISSSGSIDWFCLGRFDSPAVFCRILDAEKGGYFAIDYGSDLTISRKYLDKTNVIVTSVESKNGKVTVTQFMPVISLNPAHKGDDVKSPFRILTLIESKAGKAELKIRFKPTFNFAQNECKFEEFPNGITASNSGDFLTLYASGTKFKVQDSGMAVSNLNIDSGGRVWVILDYLDNEAGVKRKFDDAESDKLLKETRDYWYSWVDRLTYNGPYREEVVRSSLALKLLTFEDTGAIVAAPTASLPEHIGGVRNWDYRYAWLRDSALILYALMTVGYQNEATDFFKWLHLTQKANPTGMPQIMYKVDGDGKIHETTLKHLEGYRKSSPVRIGNAAASQFQLDIFGEILTSAYLHFMHDEDEDTEETLTAKRDGMKGSLWSILKSLVNKAADKWTQPDNGIWEIRGKPREFLHSRLMCWAALDRGIRLAEKFRLDADTKKWKRVREQIRTAILEKGYNRKVKAFTQSFGSEDLDAGALIIPRIGFLPPTDPRVVSTINLINEKLSHDGLIYRYRTEDGLPGTEATFSLCTFWQVDALALSGRQDEAQDLFEKMISYANDVGLMSEEVDPKTDEFLGNFPQGFTHLALIGSAVNLTKAAKHGAEQEPENEAQRAGRAKHSASGGPYGNPRRRQRR